MKHSKTPKLAKLEEDGLFSKRTALAPLGAAVALKENREAGTWGLSCGKGALFSGQLEIG
jgi:hypothetical protein